MNDVTPIRKTSIPLLGLLTWRPMAGYELKSAIEGSLANFWSESYGQLYPQLAALEASGLVETDPDAPSDTRRKKVYRITQAGRDHLADWLDKEPHSRPPRNELLMKVFFGAEGDADSVADHLHASLADTKRTLAKYRGIEADLIQKAKTLPKAKLWLMTVRHGIAHAQTHIDWCEDSLKSLTDMMENGDV
ncbi:MAG: PadR family transcriptional regulator [Paracoccaceae bacterium]